MLGTEHAYTALVHVEQSGLSATVTGVVTDGWGKTRPVIGRYMEIPCAPDQAAIACSRGNLTMGALPAADPVEEHDLD